MITIKERYESEELKLLRYLNLRMSLPAKEAQYCSNLEKGFEGECKFDQVLEALPDGWQALKDLLYEQNNTFFQIDILLIAHDDTLFLYDVKNFDGDYYV